MNGRDIEVLREVKRLRDEGLTTDQVNGKLGNIAIPDLPAPDDTEATQNATDGPGAQIAPIVGNGCPDDTSASPRRFSRIAGITGKDDDVGSAAPHMAGCDPVCAIGIHRRVDSRLGGVVVSVRQTWTLTNILAGFALSSCG